MSFARTTHITFRFNSHIGGYFLQVEHDEKVNDPGLEAHWVEPYLILHLAEHGLQMTVQEVFREAVDVVVRQHAYAAYLLQEKRQDAQDVDHDLEEQVHDLELHGQEPHEEA